MTFNEDGQDVPYEWGRGFVLQNRRWGTRLLCSTDGDRIDFLLRLILRYPGPYGLVFILEDNSGLDAFAKGRYSAPGPLSETQLKYFLAEFHELLQTDGRHHLMVYCLSTDGTVVYDQHDYFFVYGGVDELIKSLRSEGFIERDYSLGMHVHRFNGDTEPNRRLLQFWNWSYSPLEATDTDPRRHSWYQRLRMKLRAWWFDRKLRAPD